MKEEQRKALILAFIEKYHPEYFERAKVLMTIRRQGDVSIGYIEVLIGEEHLIIDYLELLTFIYEQQVKPIATVGISHDIKADATYRIQGSLSEHFKGYHVIVYNTVTDKPIFQVFYQKDYEEKSIVELKKYVNRQIKRIKK